MLNIKRYSSEDNFAWMLGALILMLFFSAFADHAFERTHGSIVNFAIALTLLVAVWSLNTGHHMRVARVLISTILLLVVGGDLLVNRIQMELLNLALFCLVLVMAAVYAARQVLLCKEVTGNIIIGAMVLYLLMGILWAIAYLLIETASPGAMRGLEEGTAWQDNLQTMIYYSFVTISTLGYGDLVPQQPLSQFLAYMEALVGQFYLSILVASLVSAGLSTGKSSG